MGWLETVQIDEDSEGYAVNTYFRGKRQKRIAYFPFDSPVEQENGNSTQGLSTLMQNPKPRLQQMCRERGLADEGKKRELCARLKGINRDSAWEKAQKRYKVESARKRRYRDYNRMRRDQLLYAQQKQKKRNT